METKGARATFFILLTHFLVSEGESIGQRRKEKKKKGYTSKFGMSLKGMDIPYPLMDKTGLKRNLGALVPFFPMLEMPISNITKLNIWSLVSVQVGRE